MLRGTNGACPQLVEAQLFSDLGCGHGVREVLFVGEYEEDGIPQLILLKLND